MALRGKRVIKRRLTKQEERDLENALAAAEAAKELEEALVGPVREESKGDGQA